MTVMYLWKHSFQLLIGIYCENGYEMHSQRLVTFLEMLLKQVMFPIYETT
jgi:hypothetical protein